MNLLFFLFLFIFCTRQRCPLPATNKRFLHNVLVSTLEPRKKKPRQEGRNYSFCCCRKYPYLPHQRISLRPPTPLENSHFSFILSFELLGLKSYLVIAWPGGLYRIRHTTANQNSLAWRLYHVCFLEPVLSKSHTWSFIII